MARPGITYTEVVEAATTLVGQNRNPTVEQIRLLIGSGSSTTIANHLRKWKSQQSGVSLLAAKENLPPELIALLKGLWERVITESELKVSEIESHYQQANSELQQELHKYKTNNQRWQQLFNQWIKDKEQLQTDNLALAESLSALQKNRLALEAKLDGQSEQLMEKRLRIEELHRLHVQAQNNLKQYRESVEAQRLAERQQLEQQKQEQQEEMKSLKEQLALAREKMATTQNQYQTLQHIHGSLEKEHSQLEAKHEKQQQQLAQLEKSKTEYQQSSQHWESQHQQMQKALQAQTTQHIELQTQLQILKQQLADIQVLNKTLEQEKWTLVQEKAQLLGELKHTLKRLEPNKLLDSV